MSKKNKNQKEQEAVKEQTTEQTTEPTKMKQVKVRFYRIAPDFTCGDRKGQAKLVCAAVATLLSDGKIGLDAPVRADELASAVAEIVRPQGYKVRNDDVKGSVGFHLHQLSRGAQPQLSRFDQVQGEDGTWTAATKAEAAE